MPKTAIQAELPQDLVSKARAYVAAGWAADLDWLLAEALGRYLESHSTELAEKYLLEDVAWGLSGRE
jgi:hypothetical protein